jgi:HD-GYP domain-containing protein (c-di-GMP phosphodiesterase class II)
MTSGRNGQTALSWEDAIHDLKRGAGSRFDPKLVPVFIAAMEPPVLAVT